MQQTRRFSSWYLLIIVASTFHVPLCRATGIAGHVPEVLVTKECRKTLAYTDAGEITAVDVSDGRKDVGSYHLEFFTLDVRSQLLPILLHTNMVLYVHTGRGTVNWVDKKKVVAVEVEPGDIYKLEQGTVFYIQSSADPTREKLRIHAIFDTVVVDDENTGPDFVGVFYSNVSDLVRGFDAEVLQMGLGVPPEVIQEIKSAVKPPPIVPSVAKNATESRNLDWREGVFDVFFGEKALQVLNGKKKKEVFNIIKRKPDVENSHGRSIAVTRKDAKSLKGSSMGLFMVNLTRSSMMGPHWNPKATEIAIVVRGRGMVQVVSPCKPSGLGDDERSTMRFYVKEGDVFVVPRFHPMVQMSFENESFVFVGFSSNAGKNHPQFLAGRWSVLRTLDREILAAAFNVTIVTMDKLVAAQEQAVLLGCAGCAEEERRKLEMEMEEKKKHEEEGKREEERRREEERKSEEEEEEERERKEEEKRREEERERQEEERKMEEGERERKEEEKRWEEERREAEERKREEEEEEEEEKEKERKEEEKRREKERERQEEQRKREEEERERKEEKRWEEERRREEEGRKKEEEEEELEKKEEEKSCEEEGRRKMEEEEYQREEEARREVDEHRREEEEARREVEVHRREEGEEETEMPEEQDGEKRKELHDKVDQQRIQEEEDKKIKEFFEKQESQSRAKQDKKSHKRKEQIEEEENKEAQRIEEQVVVGRMHEQQDMQRRMKEVVVEEWKGKPKDHESKRKIKRKIRINKMRE